MKNKKGFANQLQAVGAGIIGLALIIGVGLVVLTQFGGTVSGCPSYQPWNVTTDTCYNATSSTNPTSTAWVDINYINTQLGQTGLAGWVPAIIALTVGLLFLGAFLLKGNRSF